MENKFQLYKSNSNGLYYFRLISGNGQVVLRSEGYTSIKGCENGIASVKMNSGNLDNFQRKMSVNSKFYFNLKASNGQIIGTSELYFTESAMENGINIVKLIANPAETVHLSE